MSNDIDYGPLKGLVGTWSGDKGHDLSPRRSGSETTAYRETIVFSVVGHVTNAAEQSLAAVHYHQIVRRRSDNSVFHDQSGYWMWDSGDRSVMHAFVIPRGVAVLAGGHCTGGNGCDSALLLDVSAAADDSRWSIVQSPFMGGNARTIRFSQQLTVGDGVLRYSQTMHVEIYGALVEHTDHNELTPG